MTVEVFELSFKFAAAGLAREELLERFLAEAIEANGLQFGGGGSTDTWTGFVEPAEGMKISALQREQVEMWLAGDEQVCEHSVGAIVEDVPNSSFKPKPLRGSD